MNALHRGRPTKEGNTGWLPVGAADASDVDRIRQMVQELVGYKPQPLEIRP
jgi:hypothetical protein